MTPPVRPFLLVAFAGIVTTALAVGPRQAPSFVVHPVAGNVSYLEGAGGNIGLCLGEDGLLVIDDQLANQREGVTAAIRGFSEAPVRYLLNTHWHGDHTGNNAVFGATTPIVAHDNVRRRLAADPTLEGRSAEDTPREALPTLTYESSVTLHLNGDTIVVRHFPKAHTDGDSVVHFTKAKVLHLGDILFNGRFPFIDLDSGGSVEGYVAAVGAVLDGLAGDEKLIPGHGPLATVEDLRRYHQMLLDTTSRVRAALAEGKTAEQMAAEGLLDEWSDWSWQFVNTGRYLETLARGLAR